MTDTHAIAEGRVARVVGPVVDVEFPPDRIPPLYNALTVEVNLALALQQAGAGDVDFATIWGQGHTMAELTGTGEENFIAWVTKQAAS